MINMHNHYNFLPERLTNSLKNLNIYPKNVLDIGANIGQFYQEFKSIFPESNILSIEGNPNCQDELFKINPLSIIALLGKEPGESTFYTPLHSSICSGASVYKENTVWYENHDEKTLPVLTLDSFNFDKTYDYIKIDVQGAELDIIKGGLKTILECDILQLELSILKYNNNAPLISEVISYLYHLGFYIYEIGSLFYWNNRLNQSDFLFINSRRLGNLLNL
jgi:FkbM family methyltransferase